MPLPAPAWDRASQDAPSPAAGGCSAARVPPRPLEKTHPEEHVEEEEQVFHQRTDEGEVLPVGGRRPGSAGHGPAAAAPGGLSPRGGRPTCAPGARGHEPRRRRRSPSRSRGSRAAAGGAEPCVGEERGRAIGAATAAAGSRASSRGRRERGDSAAGGPVPPARRAPGKPGPPPAAHWRGRQSPTSHWRAAPVTEGPAIPLLREEGETDTCSVSDNLPKGQRLCLPPPARKHPGCSCPRGEGGEECTPHHVLCPVAVHTQTHIR